MAGGFGKTSTSRSEHPLITFGWSTETGSALTMPSNLTTASVRANSLGTANSWNTGQALGAIAVAHDRLFAKMTGLEGSVGRLWPCPEKTRGCPAQQ
jgi:hypothetical protein